MKDIDQIIIKYLTGHVKTPLIFRKNEYKDFSKLFTVEIKVNNVIIKITIFCKKKDILRRYDVFSAGGDSLSKRVYIFKDDTYNILVIENYKNGMLFGCRKTYDLNKTNCNKLVLLEYFDMFGFKISSANISGRGIVTRLSYNLIITSTKLRISFIISKNSSLIIVRNKGFLMLLDKNKKRVSFHNEGVSRSIYKNGSVKYQMGDSVIKFNRNLCYVELFCIGFIDKRLIHLTKNNKLINLTYGDDNKFKFELSGYFNDLNKDDKVIHLDSDLENKNKYFNGIKKVKVNKSKSYKTCFKNGKPDKFISIYSNGEIEEYNQIKNGKREGYGFSRQGVIFYSNDKPKFTVVEKNKFKNYAFKDNKGTIFIISKPIDPENATTTTITSFGGYFYELKPCINFRMIFYKYDFYILVSKKETKGKETAYDSYSYFKSLPSIHYIYVLGDTGITITIIKNNKENIITSVLVVINHNVKFSFDPSGVIFPEGNEFYLFENEYISSAVVIPYVRSNRVILSMTSSIKRVFSIIIKFRPVIKLKYLFCQDIRFDTFEKGTKNLPTYLIAWKELSPRRLVALLNDKYELIFLLIKNVIVMMKEGGNIFKSFVYKSNILCDKCLYYYKMSDNTECPICENINLLSFRRDDVALCSACKGLNYNLSNCIFTKLQLCRVNPCGHYEHPECFAKDYTINVDSSRPRQAIDYCCSFPRHKQLCAF